MWKKPGTDTKTKTALHVSEYQKKWYRELPMIPAVLLVVIVLGCLFCEAIITKDPIYMDLKNCSVAPNKEFLFGTDTMGRDLFSMIWYGGRISLFIGIASALISAVAAVVFGTLSASMPVWLDAVLMRLTDIIISVPNLLLVILIQAVLGKATVVSISFVLGITGWMSIAKVVRTQVRQIRNSGYVIAAKRMGGRFFHVLWRHLAPNFVSSVLFMVVMNVRNAIVAESTLSFMGIGLPVEIVTWGSMLSLAEKALLTDAWWIILIPGMFLVMTMLCITSLGNYLRRSLSHRERNM